MCKQHLAVLFSIYFFTSCSVSDRISYGDSEGAIPEDVINAIKSKKVKKSWVLANLGEPFTVDSIDPGSQELSSNYEVYNYRLEKTHVRSGHVLFLLHSGVREDTVEYFHVAFDNNQVDKAWLDTLPRAALTKRIEKMAKQEMKPLKKVETPDIVDNDNRFAWKLPILKKWFSQPSRQAEASEKNAVQPDAHEADNPGQGDVAPPKNLAPTEEKMPQQDVEEVILSEPK